MRPCIILTSGVEWLFIDAAGYVRDVCPIVCGHIRAGLIRVHPLFLCKMTNKSTERIYRIDGRTLKLDQTDRMILGAIDDARRSSDGVASTSDVIAYGNDMYGEEETPTSMTIRRHMDSLAADNLIYTFQMDEHPDHPTRKPPRAAKTLPWGLNVLDEVGASLPKAEDGLTSRTRDVEQDLRSVRDELEQLEDEAVDPSRVADIRDDVDVAFEQLSNWKRRVNQNDDGVKQMKKDRDRLDQKVAQQGEQIEKLQSRLDGVEGTVETHGSYLDDVQEWTDGVQKRIESVESRLEDVEDAAEHWRSEWDTWLSELRERTQDKTPGGMFSRLKSN